MRTSSGRTVFGNSWWKPSQACCGSGRGDAPSSVRHSCPSCPGCSLAGLTAQSLCRSPSLLLKGSAPSVPGTTVLPSSSFLLHFGTSLRGALRSRATFLKVLVGLFYDCAGVRLLFTPPTPASVVASLSSGGLAVSLWEVFPQMPLPAWPDQGTVLVLNTKTRSCQWYWLHVSAFEELQLDVKTKQKKKKCPTQV